MQPICNVAPFTCLRANEALSRPLLAIFSMEACVNGVLASKLDVHINIGFVIITIFFSEYTQVGKGQWPSEWGGLVSGE